MMILNSTDNVNDFLTVVNTQLYQGDEQDYVRQAQALYLLQQSCSFVRNFYHTEEVNKKKTLKVKVQTLTKNEKKLLN